MSTPKDAGAREWRQGTPRAVRPVSFAELAGATRRTIEAAHACPRTTRGARKILEALSLELSCGDEPITRTAERVVELVLCRPGIAGTAEMADHGLHLETLLHLYIAQAADKARDDWRVRGAADGVAAPAWQSRGLTKVRRRRAHLVLLG